MCCRYDHATFFPQSVDANYSMVGEGAGRGYNVNIPLNGRKMGDREYLMVFQSLVLPIAYEFQPELVLVSAGFDAAAGDPLGGYRLSPAMYGHMTAGLAALASGRLVLALEGGYCLPAIAECSLQCARALLGDPLPPLHLEPQMKPSAVETVRNVIRAQAPYWSCLAQYSQALPEDLALVTCLAAKEQGGQVRQEGVEELSRSFRKMEVDAACGDRRSGEGGAWTKGGGAGDKGGGAVANRRGAGVEEGVAGNEEGGAGDEKGGAGAEGEVSEALGQVSGTLGKVDGPHEGISDKVGLGPKEGEHRQ